MLNDKWVSKGMDCSINDGYCKAHDTSRPWACEPAFSSTWRLLPTGPRDQGSPWARSSFEHHVSANFMNAGAAGGPWVKVRKEQPEGSSRFLRLPNHENVALLHNFLESQDEGRQDTWKLTECKTILYPSHEGHVAVFCQLSGTIELFIWEWVSIYVVLTGMIQFSLLMTNKWVWSISLCFWRRYNFTISHSSLKCHMHALAFSAFHRNVCLLSDMCSYSKWITERETTIWPRNQKWKGYCCKILNETLISVFSGHVSTKNTVHRISFSKLLPSLRFICSELK